MAMLTKDFQAVATANNKDLLFYVKDDGTISFFESQSPREADLKQYKEQEVQMDGESILANQEISLITAVAYKDPTTFKEEVRVYYVAKGRKIRELTRTDGGEWKNGKGFNDIEGVVAEKDPSLTANVAFGQLKVHYQSQNQPKGKISMIYANLGAGNWTPKSKIN